MNKPLIAILAGLALGLPLAGMPVQFPRIAGQYAEYIEAQLKLFQAGQRANDPNGMMRGVATRMTDKEMKAVAEYAAGLR